jgi:uncharacterized protein (DUF1015 family)
MATLYPFRALRPRPADAARIASVPYDVVTTDEARALADGNPLSFLRVSRPELELPPETDPHSAAVYQRALENFSTLKERALVVDREASVYLYRLRMGHHEQIGVAACYSLDEYDRGAIVKHERTRPDKEDDRTRHLITLGAQTGPVFLTYRATPDVAGVADRVTRREPLFDFDAPDGVRHTVWPVTGADRDALVAAFARIPRLYIADGHHRAASAARTRDEFRKRGSTPGRSLGDGAGVDTVLAVAFPDDRVQILPYNRVVQDLGALSNEQFLEAVGQRFTAGRGPATPAARGDIAMYFQGGWRTLRPRSKPDSSDAIASLDVSVLQDQLLAPVLGIADVGTDERIDFVGGARGVAALEQTVSSGQAAVAFSLFPVSVSDLMAVSDAGAIMPPKSTWFEPKLRDGLLIHVI